MGLRSPEIRANRSTSSAVMVRTVTSRVPGPRSSIRRIALAPGLCPRHDHTLGDKAFNVLAAEAIFRQPLAAVLTYGRRQPAQCRHLAVVAHRMGEQTHGTGLRVDDIHDHPVPRHLRVLLHVGVLIYRRVPYVLGLE